MTKLPTLEWINERPEGTDDQVVADIVASLNSVSSPENLGYHTVFLGDDLEKGPGVIVTGTAGNPNFICEYFPEIGDAFETLRPNADEGELESELAALIAKRGLSNVTDACIFVKDILRELPRDELLAMNASLDEASKLTDEEMFLLDLMRELPREENAPSDLRGTTEEKSDPADAVKAFLRGRGGKALPSDDDHILGHNAIANRIAENEQDKGA
ncbi:hypothetical protein G6L37_00400 [Agrobacterium rubi]|nr:hypothetical protein [Agrobacterium rubi]NTF23849.1 hypothetical protein [Agrobacterium rubi]